KEAQSRQPCRQSAAMRTHRFRPHAAAGARVISQDLSEAAPDDFVVPGGRGEGSAMGGEIMKGPCGAGWVPGRTSRVLAALRQSIVKQTAQCRQRDEHPSAL